MHSTTPATSTGNPGTWDDDDWFPLLFQQDANALASASLLQKQWWLAILLRNTVLPTDLGCPIPPDFLLSPVGRTGFMRLSLMKAAHVVTDKPTHRKSGYLARFWRDVGFHSAPFESLGRTRFFNRPN
jgi:hypothetical protein